MKIENLCVSFEKTVLDNFSFSADKGIYCIYAPSGTGKTTLFNAIAGLIKYSGKIEYEGKISYLFQEDRLLPQLSAKKNIMLATKDIKRAEYYIEKFGIKEFENKKPSDLSGGMQRRCALARCFAFGGDIFLFDEPFRGLDENNANSVREEIKKLEGLVLVITHDILDAQRLNAKTVFLHS